MILRCDRQGIWKSYISCYKIHVISWGFHVCRDPDQSDEVNMAICMKENHVMKVNTQQVIFLLIVQNAS